MIGERDPAEQAIGYFASPPGGPEELEDDPAPVEVTEPTAAPVGTVQVSVVPEVDESYLRLLAEAQSLLKYAEGREILTQVDVTAAADDLAIMATCKKALETKRIEFTSPLNQHLKSINWAFKAISEPLSQADTITRAKVQAWRQEQDRRRQEAERVNQLQVEATQARAKLAEEGGELPPEQEVLPALEVPAGAPGHVYTGMGTLGTTTTWKFEVVDFSLLPDRFKMENATLIGKVVRAGEREIPGVRIWSEEGLRVAPKGGLTS